MQLPCRILIGPLYNPALIGKYITDPQLRTFMPRSEFTAMYRYDLVYDLDQISHFNQIFAGLGDWEPELVLWWDPVYQTIPPGIEDCPYPIALIPGDWNLAFLGVLAGAQAVDAVFADGRLGPILQTAGIQRVYPWPGFAYDSRLLYQEPELERIYDVCFIGNMNPSIHPRRSRYLAQLLGLQDRWRLFLRHGGVWGDAYRRALNQSRIVLNYTICQVMNMRAYEAPACGALLMIEEDNVEVRDVFEDRVSCVLYNEHNLLELIDYYLSHEDERAAIAAAGQRVVQAYSYERHFERLLAKIPALLQDLGPDFAARRPALQQPPARRQLRALNQMAASNAHGLRASVPMLNQFWQQMQAAGISSAWELNALMVLLFPYLDEQQSLRQAYGVPLDELLQGFEAALHLDPHNPVLRYHHALCCEYLGQQTQALWSYSHAVELMARGQLPQLSEYREFVLPFNKSGRGFDQLAFEWERVSYEAYEQGSDPALRYVALLSTSIWQRIGRILQQQGQLAKALVAYENAFISSARAPLQLEIARLQLQQDQPEAAWQAILSAIELQPLLIGQLVDLLTPELLLRHADWIYARSHEALMIYPALAQPRLLAGLVLQARGRQLGLSWRDLLPIKLSADFYQWLCLILQRCEAAPALAALQALRQPWGLRFELPLEAEPPLELACGLFWSASPQAERLSEAAGSPLRRVYDAPSDPAAGICGPDLLPYSFAAAAPLARTQLLDGLLAEAAQPLLVVLAGWTRAQLAALLTAYEAGWDAHPDSLLLLWTPPGSAGISLGDLEALLPEAMQAQLAWIDEPLALPEQGALLQLCQGLLALPRGQGLFYSHWACALGRPLAWPEAPDWQPEPAARAFVPASSDSFEARIAAGLNYLLSAPASPAPALLGSDLSQAWLDGLWQLRLWHQVGTDRG